jgi:putative hydrolase of the HAD superfamily
MSIPRPIVFDLGRVVVEWRPDRLIEYLNADEALRARIRRDVFEHDDWLALDRGTLEHADAVQRFATRTGLPERTLGAMMDLVAPSLTPKPDTLALMRALHGAGHPLYYLSNMARKSIEHLESTQDYWNLFSGGVASCRERLLKPEPAIFECLLARYGLRAQETIFIDDMQANVDAAAALGMTAIRFTDAVTCERALRAMGITAATRTPDTPDRARA